MTDVRQQEKNIKIVVVLYKTVIEIKAIKTKIEIISKNLSFFNF